MTPERHTYQSQRLDLNYVQWGDPARPPLILIHGTRDHARSWDRTAEALIDRYCVYAPDLRGHGDSQWSIGGDYSIIDYAMDIHALGEHLGRAPYTVVGHSLGGGVALQYAGAFPEKVSKLITIEGLGGLGWANARRPAHVRMREWVESMRKLEQRQLRTYATFEEATERMVEANSHLSPELARHLTVTGVRQAENGEYTWKFDNFTHAGSPYEFNMEDARDLWNQIRCPILILWGEESWGRRFKALDLSSFHTYRSERIEKAGHWVHHDQFEVFMNLVNGFLAE